MNNRHIHILILLACLVATSCFNENGNKAHMDGRSTREIPLVQVPAMYSDPGQRMEYVLMNIWNSLADTTGLYLCDSLHIAGVPERTVEERVGLYATLALQLPNDMSARSIVRAYELFETAQQHDPQSNIYERMADLFDKYFYDPNSPLRNEDVYGAFAARMAKGPLTREERRMSYSHEARLCSLNPMGSLAADFGFVDLKGRYHTLYRTPGRLVLLFFSNPGCTNCAEITNTLQSDKMVSTLQDKGILQVVNVYIDEDLDLWRKYAVDYPKDWVSGFDPEGTIRAELLYNVRAIPSLYLLDEDKTVLLKDAPMDRILGFLEANLDHLLPNREGLL